jgi:UDP-N-acetylglucosamine diphosphorylase/glucosamine-1-phosphate N-acetyltransferase
MQTVLLEDTARGCFGPLTLLRPQFDLRCGALTLREKLELRRPDWNVVYCPRPELAGVVADAHPGRGLEAMNGGPALLLYGRVVVDEALLEAAAGSPEDSVLVSGQEVVGAVVSGDARRRIEEVGVASNGVEALGLAQRSEVPGRTVSYPWDLVDLTPDEIRADAEIWPDGEGSGGVAEKGALVMKEESVSIGEGAVVRPGAVLDARGGPILLGSDVEVMHGATIVGPAAVGRDSIVRIGAAVTGGTSIGPVCRVGGEIQGSVFQSHSNKQHGGFLGHSYVGSWVNLGAATDNSDLKNNYGNVRVELDGEVVDTRSASVGATVGDHSKTAIGTKLNTGTVIGVFCSVVSRDFTPKSIPSFSWGTPDGHARHDLEKALSTARLVMARRGVELSQAMEERIRAVHSGQG